MESVEDISIGQQLSAKIGFASEATGSHANAIVLDASYRNGWLHAEKWLSLFKLNGSGYLEGNGLQNGLFTLGFDSFYFFSKKSRTFFAINLTATDNRFEDQQVVLGGATGLRGYPLNFQTGAHSARFTLEQRYFFDWYPWRIARVGAAVFTDVGSAWETGDRPHWLSDAGIGLRIVGTRQADAKVMHIDLATPFNADNVDTLQLVVTAKTQF